MNIPDDGNTASRQALRNRNFGAFQRYPRNAWYVAAGVSEVTRAPLSRELLGTPVMLYRKEDGGVVAMHDACPHRGYPLSKSHVIGDAVQCRYHGFRFDALGKCVKIPANPDPKDREAISVTTYPVVEKWHWIWIWLGDLAKADPAEIPSFECEGYEHYDHQFYSPLGPIYGNFQLLHDNLCDVTHTSFLHAGLLDDSDNAEMAMSEGLVEKPGERVIRITRDMRDFVPNEAVAKLYHLDAGKRYNRRLIVWHHFPHALTAFNRYYHYTERFDQEHTGELAAEHITSLGLTPANPNHSYHFTAASTSWRQTDFDRDALLYVINQDVEAFSMIQNYFEKNADQAVELSVPTDRIGLQSRRIIANMVRAETAERSLDA